MRRDASSANTRVYAEECKIHMSLLFRFKNLITFAMMTHHARRTMAGITEAGENRAWEILLSMNTGAVCKAASVLYDVRSGRYIVKSFGMDFYVFVREKRLSSTAPESRILVERFGELFRLSVLRYLVTAKDIPCTNRPVKLENIRGGEIFTTGSHALPLDKLAHTYGTNKDAFLKKGRDLGGEIVRYGDASVKLFPFPRFPVVVTLWTEDEEFPAKADLMLDSTCEFQLPTDIIWSVALITVMVMM